jgi:enoyl-[acyl-carrier protein] reductase II
VRPPRRRQDLVRLRELTDRPFAVNHTRRPFSEEVFAASLEAPPAVVSLALGEPGDLVARVHDAGALFLQQVTTVEQARQAAGGRDRAAHGSGRRGGAPGRAGPGRRAPVEGLGATRPSTVTCLFERHLTHPDRT